MLWPCLPTYKPSLSVWFCFFSGPENQTQSFVWLMFTLNQIRKHSFQPSKEEVLKSLNFESLFEIRFPGKIGILTNRLGISIGFMSLSGDSFKINLEKTLSKGSMSKSLNFKKLEKKSHFYGFS